MSYSENVTKIDILAAICLTVLLKIILRKKSDKLSKSKLQQTDKKSNIFKA